MNCVALSTVPVSTVKISDRIYKNTQILIPSESTKFLNKHNEAETDVKVFKDILMNEDNTVTMAVMNIHGIAIMHKIQLLEKNLRTFEGLINDVPREGDGNLDQEILSVNLEDLSQTFTKKQSCL